MSLIDKPTLLKVPGMQALDSAFPGFIGDVLIPAADRAIKRFTKRDLEQTSYSEFYSGNGQQNVVIRQFPVLSARTTVAAASDGDALPTATVNVADTTGFAAGGGKLAVQTGKTTRTVVGYTGLTATTFTGCSGGTGTLATGYSVGTPVVRYDQNGYWGQGVNAFPDPPLVQGTQFAVVLDSGGRTSNRGLLQRLGFGPGMPFWGSPWFGGFGGTYGGKLAASRMPAWSLGQGNIRIDYAAGYSPVPADLAYAAGMLVSWMARNMPTGRPMQSESYEAYSYSIMSAAASGDLKDLSQVGQIILAYRDWVQ